MDTVTNSKYYIQLLEAAERAAQHNDFDLENTIIGEMDALWAEMNSDEKNEVDVYLRYDMGNPS